MVRIVVQKIYQKFDKSLIAALPRTRFGGKIVVVTGESEAEKAVTFLMRQKRVGIDSETRPSFKRGCCHQVALLQVSTEDICFLFRLNRIGFPDSLLRLLESDDVMKIGLSLNDDFCMLRQRCQELKPQNYVEIQQMAPKLGVQDCSLQKLYANLLGGFISKRQQLTNWEADSLSEAQQQYAATDAWVCLHLYDKIQQLLESNDYELIECVTNSDQYGSRTSVLQSNSDEQDIP